MVLFKRISGAGLTMIFVLGCMAELSAFSDGYILAAHFMSPETHLFDKNMEIVHIWNHESLQDPQSGYACYLLENGNLLRSAVSQNEVSAGAAPKQGTISEVDINGNIVWTYTLADTLRMLHHDFKTMPNGNILMVSFIHYDEDSAIAAGLDSSLFSSGGMFGFNKTKMGGFMMTSGIELEQIIELQPDRTGGGNHQIVWQWNIADHIVPSDQKFAHPEKFSGDMGPTFFGQWVHLNGIDYNPVKDLIVFSSRIFSEFFIIDHSASTAQAATSSGGNYGKGGDILFRWGRPSHYCPPTGTRIDTVISQWGRRDTTYDTVSFHKDDILHCLHSTTWIPEGCPGAGNIMFFHNNVDAGMSQLGNSQVMEVAPETDANGSFIMTAGTPTNPLTPTWLYAPTDMFSSSMSTAIRMPSGNTIVHEAYPGGNASGTNSIIREVDANGTAVWGPQEIALPPDTTVILDTIFSRDTILDVVTILRIDTLTRIQEAPFNPAKIMYYPSTYKGIQELMKKINVAKKNALYSPVRVIPQIRKAAGVLRFSNVSGTTIALYTLKGRLVKKLHPGMNSAILDTRVLGKGSYIVTISSGGKVSYNKVISLVR